MKYYSTEVNKCYNLKNLLEYLVQQTARWKHHYDIPKIHSFVSNILIQIKSKYLHYIIRGHQGKVVPKKNKSVSQFTSVSVYCYGPFHNHL